MPMEFIGDLAYGGRHTVTEGLDKNSVIYSFGIGTNVSWDLELIKRFGCKIYAYDPNPIAAHFIKQSNLPDNFIFKPVGLASYDGVQYFYGRKGKVSTSTVKRIGERASLPVRRLQTLMQENGHAAIDVLKIDIEGSEFFILPAITSLPVRQILVEIHTHFYRHGLKGLRRLWGKYLTARALRALKRSGFTLKKQDNEEDTFLREDPTV
jgi:FkbM family methyltransferase